MDQIYTPSATPSERRFGELLDLGFSRDYGAVWNLQKQIVQKRIRGEANDTLILVEHDHVLTLGRSSHIENVLLKDLPTFDIERGGDVTYHGPGQLVAYPILSLQERGLGVRQYVEKLESTIMTTLASIGLENCVGKLGKDTGVWTPKNKKLASIGIAVSHWITYHGFALNVNTDLTYFQRIKPCGFDSDIMTSISKELGVKEVSMAQVRSLVVQNFARFFNLRFHTV